MKYIWLTIQHKYFVFRAGLKTKTPIWNLIVHDWSKFLLWRAYNNAFFGDKTMDREFAEAWLYHQNHEKHHWEYWIPRTSHNKLDPTMKSVEPIEMPERFVREMVADWMGAGRAYEGAYPDPANWKWFEENRERIWEGVHPNTREMILQVIDELKMKNKLTQHLEYKKKRIEAVQARKFNGNRWDFANANGAMSPGDCRKEADYCMRDCENVADEVFEIGYQKGVDDTKDKNSTLRWWKLTIAVLIGFMLGMATEAHAQTATTSLEVIIHTEVTAEVVCNPTNCPELPQEQPAQVQNIEEDKTLLQRIWSAILKALT